MSERYYVNLLMVEQMVYRWFAALLVTTAASPLGGRELVKKRREEPKCLLIFRTIEKGFDAFNLKSEILLNEFFSLILSHILIDDFFNHTKHTC